MRVAVIGGTGFVGSHIADALDDAGHSVTLLVRPGSESKVSRPDRFMVVSGDLDSPDSLTRCVSGSDAVVYSVGILREFPRRGITFEALQYEGVVHTVEAARRAGTTRFVLISANGVKVPGTRYQETKARAEKYVRASGLQATVLRPSVIFGDPLGRMEFATQLYRDMVATPLPALEFFSGTRPAAGQVLMSPVHVTDVAEACLAALENASTVGRVYQIGGPEVLSWAEMIRRIGAAVGRRKWLLPVPLALMQFAALLFERLPFFPVTRDQLTMLAEGNVADPAGIETLLGREPLAFTPATLAYLCR